MFRIKTCQHIPLFFYLFNRKAEAVVIAVVRCVAVELGLGILSVGVVDVPPLCVCWVLGVQSVAPFQH